MLFLLLPLLYQTILFHSFFYPFLKWCRIFWMFLIFCYGDDVFWFHTTIMKLLARRAHVFLIGTKGARNYYNCFGSRIFSIYISRHLTHIHKKLLILRIYFKWIGHFKKIQITLNLILSNYFAVNTPRNLKWKNSNKCNRALEVINGSSYSSNNIVLCITHLPQKCGMNPFLKWEVQVWVCWDFPYCKRNL